MSTHDVIVIGAGVSGLVFAEHAADGGRRVLVLEKAPQVGGCLDSWEAAPGYHVEMGAHTAYNSYGALLEILARRGRLGELLRREKAGYHFLNHGQLQSPLARLNWPSLLTSLPVGVFKDKSGLSVRDYYSALFGAGNYARVLGPAFAAVLSQPCDDYPAAWLFRRKPRMKSAPRKYSWATGLQGLLAALIRGAPYETRVGVEARAVTRVEDGYQVETDVGSFTCKTLALATPPDVAGDLLVTAAPGVSALLEQFPMAEIESVAVLLARAKSRLPTLAGLIGVDDAFYSVVSRDPVPHPELRAFTFHFRPGRYTLEAKRRRMAEVLGCAEDDFLALRERVNRLPSLDTRHLGLVERLDTARDGQSLALIGNYQRGMSIGDCAERAVAEARRLFA
jgi:protoporphyrinogen oxidase